ncbi:MAG: SAM-dependent methyltransferase [Mycobacterium sp.]
MWNPATSMGASATLVAAARAVATRRELINDPFAEPLVRAVGVDFFTRVASGELDVTDLDDDAAFARMTELFAVRTRFFDEFFADAGRAGIRQAVILASGLDARPYRLWWPAKTTVYEIDQPGVVEFKTQTLRRLGVTPATNRRAVGVDLRQDWPAALRRIGFDATQPSAWIAEGLFIGFLPPAAQDRLIDGITALSAPGSRFAADHVPGGSPPQAHQEHVAAARWREHGLDVDLTGLTYPGECEDAAEYLAAQGWETVGSTLADVCAATGLPRLGRDTVADAPVLTWYVTATRNAAA